MLGPSQRAGERKRGEICLANYFLLLLRSQRLYWRCCCSAGGFAGDEKPSPATGSCKSPAFSSFSYFPKIISNNLTLADNPKLQQKSTNSVFIKKPHQRNSTLSLSIAGENWHRLEKLAKQQQYEDNGNRNMKTTTTRIWMVFVCLAVWLAGCHFPAQRLLALPHIQHHSRRNEEKEQQQQRQHSGQNEKEQEEQKSSNNLTSNTTADAVEEEQSKQR